MARRKIVDTFNEQDMGKEIRKANTLILVKGKIEVSGIWEYSLEKALTMLKRSKKVNEALIIAMENPFNKGNLVRAAVLLGKDLELAVFSGEYTDAGCFQAINYPLIIARKDGTFEEGKYYSRCLKKAFWDS